jgi:aconitase A
VTVELDGGSRSFHMLARLDAEADVTVYRDGGLLQMMMLRLAG